MESVICKAHTQNCIPKAHSDGNECINSLTKLYANSIRLTYTYFLLFIRSSTRPEFEQNAESFSINAPDECALVDMIYSKHSRIVSAWQINVTSSCRTDDGTTKNVMKHSPFPVMHRIELRIEIFMMWRETTSHRCHNVTAIFTRHEFARWRIVVPCAIMCVNFMIFLPNRMYVTLGCCQCLCKSNFGRKLLYNAKMNEWKCNKINKMLFNYEQSSFSSSSVVVIIRYICYGKASVKWNE